MSDLISRAAAIEALSMMQGIVAENGVRKGISMAWQQIADLPPAQPGQPSEIQDILEYLDTVLHPIISPEHWNVYSELHDMISTLPSAQPERKKGRWIEIENEWGGLEIICSECASQVPRDAWGNAVQSDYCYRCGADMRGEEE